jgi:hypothetical protein
VVTHLKLFFDSIASQCLSSLGNGNPSAVDCALAGTLFVLIAYAAYRLLHGLFRPDTPVRQALKASVLRD